jgi:chaperonin GroES
MSSLEAATAGEARASVNLLVLNFSGWSSTIETAPLQATSEDNGGAFKLGVLLWLYLPVGRPMFSLRVGTVGPAVPISAEIRPQGNLMKLRPLQDRVLIRRVEQEAKTSGGIIIPDTVQEKPMQGEVVAAGPGARDEHGTLRPLDVKAGDRVLFGKWSGAEIKLDGEDLLIMQESDIMGVIDQAAAKKQAA